MKRLLSYDPLTRIKTWWHEDVMGNITVHHEQDVEDLVARNRAQYNAHSDHGPTRWKGNWHHVGEIPMSVYHDLEEQGILHDKSALFKWLNDPDQRDFRTKPGRL